MSINNSGQASQQHSEMIVEESNIMAAGATSQNQSEQQRQLNGEVASQTQHAAYPQQQNNQEQPSTSNNLNMEQNLNQNSSVLNASEDMQQNENEFTEISISDYFQKGFYMDVREHLGDWRVGIILQILEKQQRLQIQFDGSKSDEYVHMSSNKLAHFRKFTRGYTGEKNNASRVKRNIEDIKLMIQPFKHMIKANYQGFSAFDYTQDFRGKYFFAMDQALQNISYEDESREIVIKLIKNHIDYTIKYIREFPNYFQDYYKEYSNQLSYMYDLPVAIAHGSYEMFEMLLFIFGSTDRLVTNQNCFYAKNWFFIRENQDQILEEFPEKIIKIHHTNLLENDDNDGMQEEIIGQQQSLIQQQKAQLRSKIRTEIIPIFQNYFWLNGGFEAMNQLFSNQNKMIPLPSLFQITKIICFSTNNMKEKYIVIIIDELCNYIIQRMSLITEREIKEYDPRLVKSIREYLQAIVKQYPDQDTQDNYLKRIDEMDLNLALKLLSSQYLNKKIQGLNDISEIIGEIKQNDSFQNGSNNDDLGFRNNSEYYSDQMTDRRYNPKEFTEWVIKNQIIDHLLGDSMHVEIVRRCHEIIRFMCFCKQFPVELIDTIWNSCGSDKHEVIVSAIFEMIISITDQLSKEALFKFHEKINSIPLSEINEQTLMLIKGFSLKAIDILIPISKYPYLSQDSDTEELEDGQEEENQEEQKETKIKLSQEAKEQQYEKNFFCLELLLKLINEDNNQNLSYSVVDNALQIAKELLCLQQGSFIAKKYANLFLEQIISGKSSYQAYYLIQALIDSQIDILVSLQKREIDLPKIIVDDICNYLQYIQEQITKLNPTTLENLKNASNQNYAFKTIIFKGKYSHENNIHVRFQLLEIVLTKNYSDNKRIFQLSPQEFDKLWNQFLQVPNHPVESQIFLNWIHNKTIQRQNQNYLNTIDISNLFTFDLMKHIFGNIFCNPDMMKYQNFTPELFNIFFYLFKKINTKFHKIQIINNLNKFKVQNEELSGMKTIWDIFGEAENKQVVNSCCDQLSEIYINHDKNYEPQFRDHYMRQLTEKCMQFLQQGYIQQSSQLIERSVQLLLLFFSKIEGQNYKKQYELNKQNQYSQYSVVNQQTFTIIFQKENVSKNIKLNQNIPFGILRKKISQEFKIPTTSFRIYCRNYKTFIEPFQDEEIIHASRNVFYVHIIEGADMTNTFHPKNFIIENNEYFDLLFNLLSLNFPTDECNNNLWELIMKLPTNDHVKQRIIKIQEPWEEILKGSFHKKLYCLNIMEELFQQPNGNSLWVQRFYASGGFKYLCEYFITLDVNIIQNALSKRFMEKLLKIMSDSKVKVSMYQDEPEKGQLVAKQRFQRLIECIHRIYEYCILREEKDLENCSQEKISYQHQNYLYHRMLNSNQNCNNQAEPKLPEFFVVEQDIVLHCFKLIIQDYADNIHEFFCHPLIEKIIRKGLAQIDHSFLQQNFTVWLNCLYERCRDKHRILKHLLPTLLHNILPDIVRYSKVNGTLVQQHNLMIPENTPLEVFRAEQTRYFFQFAQQIIQQSKEIKQLVSEFDFDQTAINITEMIISRPILETSQNNKDEILCGLFNLLKEIININPSLRLTLSRNYNLIKQVLDFSFDFPQIRKKSESIFNQNQIAIRGPKIKSSDTRSYSFDLLKQISINVPENIYQIIQYLKPLILSGEWRTKSQKDWDIVPKKNEKSSTGYVGIKNLGCICYMNALLQQLFMIPSFRQTILKCKDPQFESTAQEDNILYQLKCMFTSLCYSEKEAYNPKSFCHAFKDYDGNPTNVYEQMDIDEFFNSLMDKLENQMKGTKHSEAIKKHFGGVFSQEIISKGCQHYSEREEAYLSISLQVKNKKDIRQSLEALTQGEMLEGDNSYHCEKCDKKVVALKRTCLKKLPNHLILVLKRFEFNYDNMQKVKINQLCQFPFDIDFQEYSQQGLRKAEQVQSKQQNHGNHGEYPDNYFKYRLYGIGIHMGIADSGHYYSYIRDREAQNGEVKWMEFNDNVVKFFDPKDIPNEAFGGEEKWKQFYMMENMNMMNQFRQKIRNAYLLFYDRIEKFDEDQFQQAAASTKEKNLSSEQNVKILEFDDEQEDNISLKEEDKKQHLKMEAEEDEEMIQERKLNNALNGADVASGEQKSKEQQNQQQIEEEEENSKYEEKYCGEFKQELLKQNTSFHLHKILFSQEFCIFMNNLIHQYNQTLGENRQPIECPFDLNSNKNTKEFYDLHFIKFSLTYFFTTAIRQRVVRNENNVSLDQFYQLISQQLQKNTPAIQWLIKCFTDSRLIKEIVMSPSSDAKEIVIILLEQSCKALFNMEKGHIHDVEEESDMPKTLLGQFINALIYCLNIAENYQEYFELIYRLIQIDDDIAQYLLNRMFIGRAMEFIFSYEGKKKKNNQQMGGNQQLDFPKIPFQISDTPMMGLPSQEKQKKQYDSFNKKDRSGFADSTSITYLFRILEYLILRSNFINNNPSKIPSKINYNLQKDEIQWLYRDFDSVFNFHNKAKDKLAIKCVNNILAYLSYEDAFLIEYISLTAAKNVLDFQSQEFVRSFSLLKKFFNVQDQYQMKKIEITLQKLQQSIEFNMKFQRESDVIQQFLIKLCAQNQIVASFFYKYQQTYLSNSLKSLQEYHPNKKEADENLQKRERYDLQYFDIRIPSRTHHLNYLKNWKQKQLEKLKSGDFNFDLPRIDTDDIMPESEIAKGKYYDFFDDKEGKWKIVRCYEIFQNKRIAYLFEINIEQMNNYNLNEERELYEKSNSLNIIVLPLSTYKLFPFKTMHDHFAIQLQPEEEEEQEEEENEEAELKKQEDNDDKKKQEENNSTIIQQNIFNEPSNQNEASNCMMYSEQNHSGSDSDNQNNHSPNSQEREVGEDQESEEEEEEEEEDDAEEDEEENEGEEIHGTFSL